MNNQLNISESVISSITDKDFLFFTAPLSSGYGNQIIAVPQDTLHYDLRGGKFVKGFVVDLFDDVNGRELWKHCNGLVKRVSYNTEKEMHSQDTNFSLVSADSLRNGELLFIANNHREIRFNELCWHGNSSKETQNKIIELLTK